MQIHSVTTGRRYLSNSIWESLIY